MENLLFIIFLALMYRGEDLAALNTGKRTDVDHVFLRFGKRR